MKGQHVNPEEAVQIHADVRAKRSVGVHWGTFKLTFEVRRVNWMILCFDKHSQHYLEPPKKLLEALAAKNIQAEDFFVLRHGQTAHVETD